MSYSVRAGAAFMALMVGSGLWMASMGYAAPATGAGKAGTADLAGTSGLSGGAGSGASSVSAQAGLPNDRAQNAGLSHHASQNGFCRRAAVLPNLPPEAIWHPQQRGTNGTDMTPDVDPPYAAAMPAPPPPPASYIPPAAPVVAEPMVTGTARSAPAGRAAEMERLSSSGSYAADSAAPSATSPVPPHGRLPRPPRRIQPPVQSGLLTAGEHDDILNSQLYAAYVRDSNLGQSLPVLPIVDTRHMLSVDVRDKSGRPVPFADVTIHCSDGNSLSLKTKMDGSVVFFPGLDRLSPDIRIEASKNGRALSGAENLRLSNGDGGQSLTLRSSIGGAEKARALDLMLVIDTTGSMSDEIRYLQAELTSIVEDLKERHRHLGVRVGFVFYRDEGDQYVTRTIDFEKDIRKANDILAQQRSGGGGDYPEAMDQALIRAVGASWRPDSVKSLVLVADAPPHDDKFGRTWTAAEAARAQNIHITPVAASGVGDKAEYVMRAMAAATQSRYLFLTDDSGVGNPHAPPTVACYVVTRLDALLRRVIDSQLSGQRIEAEQGEVIRTVGQYNKGKCALPHNFRWQ